MYSLNQEFPVGKGHQSFLKRYSEMQKDIGGKLVINASVESQVFNVSQKIKQLPRDWQAQWLSNEWIENHTQAAGVGIRIEGDPLRHAILREEDFGAILFDPGSDRVFKLNKAGATLYKAIREAALQSDKEFVPRATAGFNQSQVTQFVNYLKAAGLWSIQ
jgi:hypothetical protein